MKEKQWKTIKKEEQGPLDLHKIIKIEEQRQLDLYRIMKSHNLLAAREYRDRAEVRAKINIYAKYNVEQENFANG